MRTLLSLLCIICLSAFTTVEAVNKKDLDKRIREAEEIFDAIMEIDEGIPQSLLEDAHGIVIMYQYRGGFILGAKGGRGVAFAKDKATGQWSAPAFMVNVEGSIGLQIGGGTVESVFLIMSEEGLRIFNRSKAKIGGDISAAAGPYGRNAEAKVSPDTAILAYSKAKGLYAGMSIEGGAQMDDDEANAVYYDKEGITATEILFDGAVEVPEAAKGLIQKLEASH